MDNWGNNWQRPAWYPQPSHPHVYYPPQSYPPQPYPAQAYPPHAGNHWDQPRPRQHDMGRADTYRSKYPNLNPVLAADVSFVRFDVCKRPQEAILLNTMTSSGHQPATHPSTTRMRLVSKAFPWSINITAPLGSYVTCQMVWEAIHGLLSEPLADSEWGIIVRERDKREAVTKAAKERERKDGNKRLKRIDWLGNATMFKGLEHDEDFEKKRLLPGDDACSETWMIKMGSG